MKKNSFKFTLGFTGFILFLLFAFQNCSPMRFDLSSTSIVKNANNGGVYGGKLEGGFYRFVPDFTCEETPAPISGITADANGVRLTENKKSACASSTTFLDPTLIDTSIFQSDIIGYNEGIFESEPSAPQSIPANLVEVWCRTSPAADGIETITHFDRSTNLAVTRIYQSSLYTPDFNVSRIVSSTTVTIKTASGFELIVHADQPDTKLGLFKGHLQALLGGKQINQDTSCRLGGMIDATVWPNVQVVDLNIEKFRLSPDQTSFAFLGETKGIKNLFWSAIGSMKLTNVSPLIFAPGVVEFIFTPDSKSFILRGSARTPTIPEMFMFNLDQKPALPLGDKLNFLSQGIVDGNNFSDVIITPDGKNLIYGDGSQHAEFGSGTQFRSVALSGGPATTIVPDYGVPVNYFNFRFSKATNKIVFLQTNLQDAQNHVPQSNLFHPSLVSMNLDGSEILDLTPQIPATSWIPWGNPVELAGGDRYAVLTTYAPNSRGRIDLTRSLIDVRTGQTYQLPMNWGLKTLSPDLQYALVEQDDTRLLGLVILKTGRFKNLSLNGNPFFSEDSSALFGTELLANGKNHLVQLTTETGLATALCPGLTSAHLDVIKLNEADWLIAALEPQNRALEVYRKKGNSNCQLLNSAVTASENLVGIKTSLLSPNGENVVINLTTATQTGDSLIYISLTGKPNYVINLPVTTSAKVVDLIFSGDSQKLFYSGDQIVPGQVRGFLWNTPRPAK